MKPIIKENKNLLFEFIFSVIVVKMIIGLFGL